MPCCLTCTAQGRVRWPGRREKSLAVRLTLGSAEATLTDEQIDQAVKAVVERNREPAGRKAQGLRAR
jgi:phenylalanyl-tRNA synthetase beta subunit